MKKVNRETLVEKINYLSAVSKLGLSLNDEYNLAAYKMLLATMEAEPVVYIDKQWTLVYYTPPMSMGLKIGDKLYRHAQQPVVPEVMYWQDAPVDGIWTRAAAYATGWNACRAAMLNQK